MSRKLRITQLNKLIKDLKHENMDLMNELYELDSQISREREITQDHDTMYMLVNWDHDDEYIH